MVEKPLERAIESGEVAEALKNYARADDPLSEKSRMLSDCSVGPQDRRDWPCIMHEDHSLWLEVFDDSSSGRDPRVQIEVHFKCAAISEWIARVPGLIWQQKISREFNYVDCDRWPVGRRLDFSEMHQRVERQLARWNNYTLPMESVVVSGGVGTLRLPAATDGYRLVTLTVSLDASSGVPALVSPDVWEHLRLREGTMLRGRAVWREMPMQWAEHFPIIARIPRGCLMLENPDDVQVLDQGDRAPIVVHPFSVIEYSDGATLLHDFIFATANTSNPNHRKDIEDFFERERTEDGRNGTYLLSADIVRPMWDATFGSPAAMRTSKGAELRVLEQRIKEIVNGQDCVDSLRRMLSLLETHADLKRLSAMAGIPFQKWFANGISHAEQVVRLIDAAIRSNQQQALLYAVNWSFNNEMGISSPCRSQRDSGEPISDRQ